MPGGDGGVAEGWLAKTSPRLKIVGVNGCRGSSGPQRLLPTGATMATVNHWILPLDGVQAACGHGLGGINLERDDKGRGTFIELALKRVRLIDPTNL